MLEPWHLAVYNRWHHLGTNEQAATPGLEACGVKYPCRDWYRERKGWTIIVLVLTYRRYRQDETFGSVFQVGATGLE